MKCKWNVNFVFVWNENEFHLVYLKCISLSFSLLEMKYNCKCVVNSTWNTNANVNVCETQFCEGNWN